MSRKFISYIRSLCLVTVCCALTSVLTLGAQVASNDPKAASSAAGAASRDADDSQLVVAQISDTHLGLGRAPDAADNLRRVVQMVNDRHPDAVMVTGDIGENPAAWDEAKEILGGLATKNVFYIPGNHDVNARNLERWRKYWGPDYQEFHVKWATIFGLDSQLLGNFEHFDSRRVEALSDEGQRESKKMLGWLSKEIETEKKKASKDAVVFVMQHVPISRAEGGSFPKDSKPYWVCQEPYRSRELDLLHRLGVKDIFVGHWHMGMVYNADGFTYHVAPAVSWSPFERRLGFAVHTIQRDGSVKTDFVYIPGANPHWP